ncbi:unnamed protein product [Echinostoma caproni]|uniref:C2-set_2 domain-containing protein n=1 Tax=Echinostoma caproni TaxID=27848 RepID=A0A183A8T0_9TREM|nr:unnamed protein product [Echinostoma caproni]
MFVCFHEKQKVGSCLFQSNTTSSTIGNQNFKLFIGHHADRLVCHLTVANVKYEQTGEYSCRTVHPTSEGETASALILVYHPIIDVHLELTNETALAVGQETTVQCVARGGQPNPVLRLQLGGEPITNTKFKQKSDADGILTSTVTADLVLENHHNWNLLTCHVDMDVYRNVNQTFRVLHLNGYRPLEL